MTQSEEQMQQLRSKATELLLREEYRDSVTVYSQLISLCHQNQLNHQNPDPKLQKFLCLALSNRAEARSKLQQLSEALRDCDQALEIDASHFKTLLCKGKILMSLNRYAVALECLRAAQLDPQNSESLNGLLEKCKKMEFMSRTGAFDISDWVIGKFQGKAPELAEYIGPVEVRRSHEIGGRGLFATKNIDSGTLLFVTKAIAIERSVLGGEELGENAQLVMWKNFVNQIMDSSSKCRKTYDLITTLSCGENEHELDVPQMSLFRPESEDCGSTSLEVDKNKVLSILDVNSLVEDSISSEVLGKNRGCYAIGLWILACFVNHSCVPNARRLHVGDYTMVHASRDVKAGEEITFAYFDVLCPLLARQETSRSCWGFACHCMRCRFEEGVAEEAREVEGGIEVGNAVFRMEEAMRRWGVRGREKGYLRASNWGAYVGAAGGRRRVPGAVETVAEVVGGDERVVRVVLEWLRKSGGGGAEMEKAFKLGRGLYGKVMKKQALKTLLDVLSC